MTVTINRQLNLVVPINRADQTKFYIHSSPIRPETFDFYHLVLAKTFSAFAHNGLDPMSGPSVAAMMLRSVAKSTSRGPGVNWWDGPDGVGGERGLMAEIRRLSNVILPDDKNGWTNIPLQQALDKGMIDEEERSEVVNLLTFFTVVSLVAPRVDRPRLVNGMAAVYELRTSYLSVMEFANSLKTSTTEENTGEKDPV
jgi:hypothetical protein